MKIINTLTRLILLVVGANALRGPSKTKHQEIILPKPDTNTLVTHPADRPHIVLDRKPRGYPPRTYGFIEDRLVREMRREF